MLAFVHIGRALGRKIPPAGRKTVVGTLASHQVIVGIRTAIALRLLGASGQPAAPDLYEPRLINFTGKRLTFVGMECVDDAWMAQEWICELTSDEDVAGFT